MNPRVIATFEKLEMAEWFSKVGQPITSNQVVRAHNWREALDHCASPAWQDLLLEAANSYSVKVLKADRQRYDRWNDIVDELKKVSMPMVQKKIAEVVKSNNLPDDFAGAVQWDILHVGIEAEFSDIAKPGFFAGNAYWYVNGHFPCGWDGEYQGGKLIVY